MMNVEWFRHDIIYRIISFDINVRNLEPLHIGSGERRSLFTPIDNPVIKILSDDVEKPYIPGSSLKGVFRSVAESILKTYGHPDSSRENDRYRETISSEIREGLKNKFSDVDILRIVGKLGLVSKVFGSSSYFSLISFSDFYPPKNHVPSTVGKTGIAIERRYGSVRKGGLYTVEAVEPGSVFSGFISLKNTPNYIVGLVSEIISDYINSGFIRIGGMKSRGFGRVVIDVNGINVLKNIDGTLREVKEGDLEALDNYDEDIGFDTEDIKGFLENVKGVWKRYAEKTKG